MQTIHTGQPVLDEAEELRSVASERSRRGSHAPGGRHALVLSRASRRSFADSCSRYLAPLLSLDASLASSLRSYTLVPRRSSSSTSASVTRPSIVCPFPRGRSGSTSGRCLDIASGQREAQETTGN
jgi:hypothetical protein